MARKAAKPADAGAAAAPCIFCGSASVEWPALASAGTRKFKLCQHHMGQALAQATVTTYPEGHKERIDLENSIIEEFDAIRSEYFETKAEEIKANGWIEARIHIDSRGNGHPYKTVPGWFDAISESYRGSALREYGDPTETFVDDGLLSDWCCEQVKKLARLFASGNPYRCSGDQPTRPDGRCTNMTAKDGGTCAQCRNSHARLLRTEEMKGRFNRILAIYRGDA